VIRIGATLCLKISAQTALKLIIRSLSSRSKGIQVVQTPAMVRIATAAEYAAAQLGVIARTVEKIESHLAKISANAEVQQIATYSKR
jgi:hypothetical protein